MGRTWRGEEGLDAVVPLVRADVTRENRGNAAAVDLTLSADDPSAPVFDCLVGSLIVLYAFDSDDAFQLVVQRDLNRVGVDRAALADAAHDNLIGRMADLQLLERPDGCGMVRLDGNLEASTILVPQLWHEIAGILGDEVLVSIPARDVVLFCPASRESGKLALSRARDRVLAVGDHRITEDLFRFASGSWQVQP